MDLDIKAKLAIEDFYKACDLLDSDQVYQVAMRLAEIRISKLKERRKYYNRKYFKKTYVPRNQKLFMG